MNEFFLSIGSNLGNRLSNIENATREISKINNTVVELESSCYKTSPLYNYDQPYFFNKVIKVLTKLDPHQFLKKTKTIELIMGRNIKNSHNFPRIIDIDILIFGDFNIVTEDLKVPHPKIDERRFVLEPWREISPNYKIKGCSLTIEDLYEKCLKSNFEKQEVELVKN